MYMSAVSFRTPPFHKGLGAISTGQYLWNGVQMWRVPYDKVIGHTIGNKKRLWGRRLNSTSRESYEPTKLEPQNIFQFSNIPNFGLKITPSSSKSSQISEMLRSLILEPKPFDSPFKILQNMSQTFLENSITCPRYNKISV